jgi:hypothetical protein
MAVPEQAVVLRALAQAVARPNCRLLEVGSWCGDSAVVLGNVAKANGGHLYCIDWWKGNVGTDLERIANSRDIYSLFWERVCDAGLDDTIIPIRGSSKDVAEILAHEAFDLVYLDADHRFDCIMTDIKDFAPLVRSDGILCGDDCEGWLTDFEADFLEKGKSEDFYESVHCGVVLAEGQTFPAYSIDYNIWSVKKTATGWIATEMRLDGIAKKRQFPPPLLEARGTYNIMRYGRTIFAVPHSLGAIDITDEKIRSTESILSAPTLAAARERVDAAMHALDRNHAATDLPILVSALEGHNIVFFRAKYYAIPVRLGEVRLEHDDVTDKPGIHIANTLEHILEKIKGIA